MTENEKENAITYETFRKFQRKEKNNEKLQELPKDFFNSCVEWLNEKEKKFKENNDSSLIREIENVKKLVKDIFDRRRKKILLLALHSVRSKKVSKNLLPEEEEFFEKTVRNLQELEGDLLERVLEGKKPQKSGKSKKGGGGKEEKIEEEGENHKSEKEKLDVETESDTKLVRVVEEIDKFMGTDENEYGPLEKDDLVTLPNDVADLLLKEGKVEPSEI